MYLMLIIFNNNMSIKEFKEDDFKLFDCKNILVFGKYRTGKTVLLNKIREYFPDAQYNYGWENNVPFMTDKMNVIATQKYGPPPHEVKFGVYIYFKTDFFDGINKILNNYDEFTCLIYLDNDYFVYKVPITKINY